MLIADMGLKRVIRNDIIYQYKKYFEDILNNGFTVEDVNNFYLYLKYDLSQLNEQDVKEFLTIVFNNLNLIDINTNSKVLKKFFLSQKEIDATVILNGVQLFIKEKYKLLTDYTYSEDEAQSIIFPFVEKDMVAYKNLLTDSDEFLNLNSQSYYDNKSTFNLDKMTFNINENQKKVGISATNNIHVYILEKVAPLFKSQKSVESLSSLVNERILNDSYLKENTENHWETDKNNSLPLNFNCSDSNIPINEIVSIQNRITSVSVDVEGFIGFGVYLNGFNTFSEITKFLENNVSKISCLKLTTDDGKEFIVRRNLLREYFEVFKKKFGETILQIYISCDNLNLDSPNISNELNVYSNIWFEFLIQNLNNLNRSQKSSDNTLNILRKIKEPYCGVLSLCQLISSNNDHDGPIKNYLEILYELFKSLNQQEIDEKYNNYINCIDSYISKSDIYEVKQKCLKVREIVLSIKEKEKGKDKTFVIDDNWWGNNVGLNVLNFISVISTISSCKIQISLQDSNLNTNLMSQCLITMSKFPELFDPIADLYYFNTTIYNYILDNLGDIKKYLIMDKPLKSLLILEKIIDEKYFDHYQGYYEAQYFMIGLVKSKKYYDLSYSSILKFFTLKLTEGQGALYTRLVKERKFRKDYKFSLAYYLDLKGLTIEQYLDNIEDELKDYDSLKVGIFKKKLIKKEIENIVYDHYY